MVEAGVLAALAPAATPLAPQVTALPPLAIFHDLRWLFGYERSWLGFALGMAVLVLGRSAVNGVLVWLAWPREAPRPRLAAMIRSSVVVTALTSLLMSPIVTLVFGVALLPFSWPFLAAVPVMLAIALPLSHGGIPGFWWRSLPSPRTGGWLLASFLVLSLAAIAIARLPPAGVVGVAGLAGLINARAWYGLTIAVTRPRQARFPLRSPGWWMPVPPLIAVVIFALVIGLTRLAFSTATPESRLGSPAAASVGLAETSGQVGRQVIGRAAGAAPAAAGSSRQRPILVIAGFGSSCCGKGRSLHQAEPDAEVQQFSYRGMDAAGNPLPHGPAASNLPLPLLGDRVAAQVWRLHKQTGKPVDIVAESEGTLGFDAMLARHPDAPVGSVVLLSPIVAPGQASYPEAGRQGPGLVSGYALRAMNRFVGGLSPFGSEGAQTLIDSVNSVGATFAMAAARHSALRWLALIPLADAVTLPVCSLPSSAVVVVAFHGGLLGNANVLQMVHSFLTDQQVSGRQGLRVTAEVVAAATAAWRMPEISRPSPPCPA
jgi:hypothetical protein